MKTSLLSALCISAMALSGCSYHAKPLVEQLSESQKNQFAKVYEYAVKSPRVSFIVNSDQLYLPCSTGESR